MGGIGEAEPSPRVDAGVAERRGIRTQARLVHRHPLALFTNRTAAASTRVAETKPRGVERAAQPAPQVCPLALLDPRTIAPALPASTQLVHGGRRWSGVVAAEVDLLLPSHGAGTDDARHLKETEKTGAAAGYSLDRRTDVARRASASVVNMIIPVRCFTCGKVRDRRPRVDPQTPAPTFPPPPRRRENPVAGQSGPAFCPFALAADTSPRDARAALATGFRTTR